MQANGPALENKRREVQRLVAALRRAGTWVDVADASGFRSHESLMTALGTADDVVAPQVVEFVRSCLEGKLTGTGQDRVLQPAGKIAAEGAKEIESYRRRVVFRQFDRNRDGKISRDELTGPLAPLFDRLDTNKDGFLSPDELDSWFRQREGAKSSPAPAAPTAKDGAFKPDDVPMGDKQFAYIDPKFLQREGLATFLDSQMTVWVGKIDPATGLAVAIFSPQGVARGCSHTHCKRHDLQKTRDCLTESLGALRLRRCFQHRRCAGGRQARGWQANLVCYSYRATLISCRSCLKPLDTHRQTGANVFWLHCSDKRFSTVQ